ncbi:MAG: FeoB-associated Cys-rich membrane protein [Christensenellales bacterium]|jgi:hypothetical protein
MKDIIVVLILLVMVAGILWYFFRTKKRSKPSCIGCPYANRCGAGIGGERGGSTSDNRKG